MQQKHREKRKIRIEIVKLSMDLKDSLGLIYFIHFSENSNPHVWLDNFQIVCRNYGNCIKRKIGEALLINE